MKKLFIIGTVGLALMGCQAMQKSDLSNKDQAVGMANPASEFCVKQGGRLEPKKDAQGNEYAMCHLPDGRVIEEWEYFRKHGHHAK